MSRKTCKASVTVFAFNICRGVEARLCDEKEREVLVQRGYVTRGGVPSFVFLGANVAAEAEKKAREIISRSRGRRVNLTSVRCAIMRAFVLGVYVNSSLIVLLVFLSFLLSSLRCKVFCLIAYFFLHLLICLLSFWVASERGNDFCDKKNDLGYVAREAARGREEAAWRLLFGHT